jgi:Flp pilus assembly protein TadD
MTVGMMTGGNDTPAAHVAVGERLQRQGQPRDGVPEFRRAVQIDPNNAEAQSDMAQALYEINWKHFRTPLRDTTASFGTPPAVLDEAILHMRRAVALRPNDAAWHSRLATYLSNRGRHHEAVAEYRRAMHLMPPLSAANINPSADGSISGKVQPWYDAYWTLGEELVQTGQYEEAVMNLRQALRFNPSDDALLLWLGDALNGSGHRAEARAAWRRCLAAQPPKSYYQRQARARLARY